MRNDPCPCRSGKRYKDCHGNLARPFVMQVGFVVAGTQKGGTTALASYLLDHPEVGLPAVKEVHFFDTETHFQTQPVDYGVYHAYFKPMPNKKIIGDATPVYMYWKSAPERIRQYNPAMKFIMLLRNPITRAYSHWNMERERRRDTLSFDEAIRVEHERVRSALPLQHREFSYLDRGFYTKQIERVRMCFPAEQMLIIKSEELQRSPATPLASICDFLGIAHFAAPTPRTVHARPYEAPMTQEAKDYLRAVFADEIKRLEQALGWDCSDWLAE